MSFLKTKPILFFMLALWLVASCAPKPKQAKTKLNITPSLAIANINMDGGAIVYGQQIDGPGSWGKIFRPGQDVFVDMAFGTWNFSVFAYDGANGPLTGTIECSSVRNVDIRNTTEVVDMVIDLAQCSNSGARRLDLNLCTNSQFSAVTGGTITSCDQATTGVRSWRLRTLGHRLGVPNGEFLEGPCILESDYTGGSLNRRFPSGLGNTSVNPVEFIAYTTTDCSGSPLIFPFSENLTRSKSPYIKVFENTNVLNMVVDIESLGINSPNVTLVLDSAVVSGATNYVNATSLSSFSVSGNCVAGNQVNFLLDSISFATPATCASGSFSAILDFTGVTQGVHTLRASQTVGGLEGGTNQSILVDTTGPSITLADLPAVIRGGANNNVTFNYTLDSSGFSSMTLEYAADGVTFTPITTAPTLSSPYSWATPTVDTVGSKLRLSATDNAGNSTSVTNAAFNIDSTPPTASITDLAAIVQAGTVENVTFTSSDTNGVASLSLEYAADGSNFSILSTSPVSPYAWTVPSVDTTTSRLRIVATDNVGNSTTVSNAAFSIDMTAPLIATINDQTVGENTAITTINADDISGGDTDGSGSLLTYSCVFDMTVDANIVGGTNCTALPGTATFNSLTGVLDWTPDFVSAGTYEIKITATENVIGRIDDEFFVITVTNTDRPPTISTITDQTIEEGGSFTPVNADDITGGDTDIDGDTLTYTCIYDQVVDASVVTGSNCTTLPGTVTFNTATGLLSWTTDLVSQGAFEIKITATGGPDFLSDDEIFVLTITDTTPTAEATLNGGNNWALGAGPTYSKSLAVGTWVPSTTPDLASQKLYLYHKTGCSGNAIQTQTLSAAATDFIFHVPFGQTVYSYRLSSIDDVGNESAGICSSDIRVNQGFMGYSGNYLDGVIVGNYLYATRLWAVDVFDINTNPMVPDIVASLQIKSPQSTLPQAEQIKNVLSIGNYIYLIGIRSIAVFDVNGVGTPTNPEFIGRWSHNMISPKDAVSTGSYLFMADSDGILAWDVSVPATPTLLNGGAKYPTGETGIIALDYYSGGNRLFTLGDSGIKSYDLVAFPASPPSPEAATPTGLTNASDIGIDSTNQKLYVVENVNNGQIQYWDLSTVPSLSSAGGSASFQQINKVGNIDETTQMLYGCGNQANGGAFNVSTGTPGIQATLNATLNGPCKTVIGNATHFYMLGSTGVFAGDMSAGVDILTPHPFGESSGFKDISIAGNRAVVATLSDRVQVLDMTNPHSPKQLGIIDNTGTLVDDVELIGTTAYTLSGSSFASHNITLLPSVTENWNFVLSNPSGDAFVFDNNTTPTFAFIAGSGNNLMTVDVSATPTEVDSVLGTVCAGGVPSDLAYQAGYVFIACGAANSVEVYDASNPIGAGLLLVHTVSGLTGAPISITLSPTNHAYVAIGNSGVAIIDISSPSAASLINTYNGAELAGNVRNVHIDSTIMFVVENANVYSYDISSPTAPVLKTKYFGANVSGTRVRGDILPNQYLFLAKGGDGIEILNIESPENIHR